MLSALLLLVAIVLVDPRGNFPLDDDWNFALSSWWFADHGVFRFARFTGMSLRLQVLWGALWTKAFGASFDVLRASTLVLAAGTLFIVGVIATELRITRGRFLVLAAFLFNPIFFWSSFTFMTHVPFVALSALAVLCFLRAMRLDSTLWFCGGVVAAIGSVFIRQTGVVLLMPPIVVLLVRRSRPLWITIAGAAITVLAVLYLKTDLLRGYVAEYATRFTIWNKPLTSLPLTFASVLSHHLVLDFLYGALFALPWMAPLVASALRDARVRVAWLIAAIPFVAWVAWLTGAVAPLPFAIRGAIFTNIGLGPVTLRDAMVFRYPDPVHLPQSVMVIASYVLAVLGALLFASVAICCIDRDDRIRLLAMTALAGSGILAISEFFFDRYALDSLWMTPRLVAATQPLRMRRTAIVLTVVLALFCVAATQDYFAWNRARWRAFADLRRRGVPLTRMDAGYEINQYLLGGWDGEQHMGLPGMAVVDDSWILALNRVKGYQVLAAYPYRGWFGLHRGELFIEQRQPARRLR